MRFTNSSAVGSPTLRVLATMMATLLLIVAMAAAGTAGKNLLAADGTIVVDPDGNGDFTTINEAVAAAEDGDTIHVEPGRYAESILIDKSITLRGEDAAATIIEVGLDCTVDENWQTTCPAGAPTYDGNPFGIMTQDVDVTILDLGFEVLPPTGSIIVAGGTTSIAGLSYVDGAEGGTNIAAVEGGNVTVKDSDLADGWVGSDRTGNLLVEGTTLAVVSTESDSEAKPNIVRDSQITGSVWSSGATLIEGNRFTPGPDGVAEDSYIMIDSGQGWVVRDNVIEGVIGGYAALDVTAGAGDGTIEDNTFTDNEIAISIGNESVILGNTISGGRVGIRVSGGDPTLIGNIVDGASSFGVNLGFSDAMLQDNRLCGSDVDLFVSSTSEPDIDESNEICVTGTPE